MITKLASITIQARGVTMTHKPIVQPYGFEATFEDLYSNTFALFQPKQSNE